MQGIRFSWKALQPGCGLVALNFCPLSRPSEKVACSQQGNEPLKGWLREKGGCWFEQLDVQRIPGRGRGVVVSQSVACGRTLVEIPWTLIISRKLAKEDANVQALLHDLAWTDDGSRAVRLWLLRHAEDATSPWWPWLNQLPEEDSAGAGCLPVVLAQQSHDALLGTPLQRQAELLLQSLREEWEALDQLRANHGWIPLSWHRWLWCQAIVSTRSGTLPVEGTEEEVQCIIPMLDFLNHSTEPNACIVGTPTSAKLVSVQDIEGGQEVMISYGSHSAEQFLFAFGFLPECSAEIVVPLALTEATAGRRVELFGHGRPPCLRGDDTLEKMLQVLAAEPQFQSWTRRRLLEHLQSLFEAWHHELTRVTRTSFFGLSRKPYPEAESLRFCYARAVVRLLHEVRTELSTHAEDRAEESMSRREAHAMQQGL